MASIKKTGSILIRRKGVQMSATIRDEKARKLWVAYKEDIIDQMYYFDVPLQDMITLKDAIELKLKELEREGKDQRTIGDVKRLEIDFKEFIEFPLNKIKYDALMEKIKDMLKATVFYGGAGKGTGSERVQSSTTVLRKIRVLSTVFSNMINQGVNVENPALRVAQYLHTMKEKT
ncbi:MAG: hypothetical protein A3F13_02545 [Gammaproteobacteria bacterium RIFCSPHIGHO2_12_FULL_40_19]|nr:MAG: hypothetical protein A3F13_02545 [Gammaproteobacteria bacterium RIFCSPHIGHO2_12_FULL_40_19]